MFIVIMTLAWWSLKCASVGAGSVQLESAISDVTWVLSSLIHVLTSRTPTPCSSPSKRLSNASHKAGPPEKRRCLRSRPQ